MRNLRRDMLDFPTGMDFGFVNNVREELVQVADFYQKIYSDADPDRSLRSVFYNLIFGICRPNFFTLDRIGVLINRSREDKQLVAVLRSKLRYIPPIDTNYMLLLGHVLLDHERLMRAGSLRPL